MMKSLSQGKVVRVKSDGKISPKESRVEKGRVAKLISGVGQPFNGVATASTNLQAAFIGQIIHKLTGALYVLGSAMIISVLATTKA